jgi:hypothetical protein
LIELTLNPSLVVRSPKSLTVTLANWKHPVLHLKIYRREQIASETRRNKCTRNGRLRLATPRLILETKFPDNAEAFPVFQNIFPVNSCREM